MQVKVCCVFVFIYFLCDFYLAVGNWKCQMRFHFSQSALSNQCDSFSLHSIHLLLVSYIYIGFICRCIGYRYDVQSDKNDDVIKYSIRNPIIIPPIYTLHLNPKYIRHNAMIKCSNCEWIKDKLKLENVSSSLHSLRANTIDGCFGYCCCCCCCYCHWCGWYR